MAETGKITDHKAFLKSLSAEQRQVLLAKSDAKGLVHLAMHWGLIGLTGTLIAAKIPFWPLLLPLQGILIIGNFTLLHECTHKTPFQALWLNETVGRIAGFLVGLPFLWFRYFHFAHHKYTNDPALDPELLGAPKPRNLTEYLWHITGLPVWWSQGKVLAQLALGTKRDSFLPKSVENKVRMETIFTVILYGVTMFYSLMFSDILLITWILPVFLGQPFLRLFLLAEHGRCPEVANMLENSRTTKTSFLVRFVTWNMPYHAEHHTYPNVPFHRLPELHGLLLRYLKTTENGYLRFHQAYVTGFRDSV